MILEVDTTTIMSGLVRPSLMPAEAVHYEHISSPKARVLERNPHFFLRGDDCAAHTMHTAIARLDGCEQVRPRDSEERACFFGVVDQWNDDEEPLEK